MAHEFEQELRTGHWPRSAAELAAAGITRDTIRGHRWRRTSRGYFVPAGTAATTTQRILDIAPLLPASGALAGWAAAYVHGVGQLDGRDPESLASLPLVVNLGRDLGRADTETVHYVRERLPPDDRQVRHSLGVTTPERTAFDGARWASNLVEAVVFLDQVGHALPLSMPDLARRYIRGSRWPGLQQFGRALPLADPGSASPWETRLRIFYQLRAGLPRPLVNVPVFDLDGNLLGIPDLLDPEAGLITEFDGQDHRRRRQHQADNLREERLETANLVVCRVDSLDLRQPVPLIERLRARYAQARSRDRRRDRWTIEQPAWWRRRRAS
jgi:hypothetical protein